MALEQLALRGSDATRPYALDIDTRSELPVIGTAALWPMLLADLQTGRPAADIARAFHHGLADAILTLVLWLSDQNQVRTAALSGGVMQNRVLLERLHSGLQAAGLKVLLHEQLPANDGGISLGQAVIGSVK